jgi:hypothetical protein
MRTSREAVSLALFNLLQGATILKPNEPWTVPATPGPYTVTVEQAGLWTSDAGIPGLTLVSGAPGPNQYAAAAGVYTFNAAQQGAAVLISYNYSYAVYSRGAVLPSQADAQPALYLHSPRENTAQEFFGMTGYTLDFVALTYARIATSPTAPSDSEAILNSIVDSIDNAMRPARVGPGIPQTLGGLVLQAWIDGTVDRVGGIRDSQIVVVIPIKVLTGL